MKRTALRRTSSLKRTGFSLGARREPKSRKPINKVGARKDREREVQKTFREAVLARVWCERCAKHSKWVKATDPHHMHGRGRGAGHPDLHDPHKNGCALCWRCHHDIEAHACEDWADYIKDRAWLDAGGRIQEAKSA